MKHQFLILLLGKISSCFYNFQKGMYGGSFPASRATRIDQNLLYAKLINNQPASVTAQLSSEKQKQPMQNMSPLGTSRMGNQFVHPPPFSLTSAAGQTINQPLNQHVAPGRSSWNAVSSSRVDVNNVKSISSKGLSSFIDIRSANPDGEPITPIAPKGEDESRQRKMKPNFCDLESIDRFLFEEEDTDSTGTSMNKRSKIEWKNWAILEEMKELNGKLLETSLEVSEAKVSLHGDYEGTIVRCLYKNVSCPELPSLLMGGASSEKLPEFGIELLVPVDYPVSSPIVSNSFCNVQSELGGMLFKETVSRFERTVRELREKMSIGDMARHWDVCCRTVIMELAQQRGARNYLVSGY